MSDNLPDNQNKENPGGRTWWLAGAALVILATMLVCAVALAATAGILVVRRLAADPATATTATGTVLPAAGRIALVAADGALTTLNPDGSDARSLGEPDVGYQFPAWSADGTRIAAVATGGTQAAVQVIEDSAATAPVELYGNAINPPFYLYWSPDDRQVSFLANDRNSIALWLAAADGQTAARKIATGQPFYWSWTADSRQLLVHSGGLGAESRLAFIDTEGNAAGGNLATPGLFQAPGISPDGRYLAFSQASGEQFEVAVQEAAGGAQSTVRQLGLSALSWSPANDDLAFISPGRRQLTFVGPLQVIDAATGAVRTLVQDRVIAFFWSPDGKTIATLTQNSGRSSPGAARSPEFTAASPAGSQQAAEVLLDLAVVDVDSGQSRTLASFRPSDVFLGQFLPYFDQYALSHRIWSPASDALVLPMVDDRGEAGIYVVSLEGGAPTRIANGVMAFWSR
ncbi:MAG: hypothetical protein R2844_18365 [Caldilineales bacterium]